MNKTELIDAVAAKTVVKFKPGKALAEAIAGE